jgi:hypothetical protein
MNQGEIEQKKSNAKWIAIAILVVAIIIVAFVALNRLNSFVNRPDPDITMFDVRSGFEGFDYFVYTDVRVVNEGGEGWVKVFSEIRGSMYEEQNQRIYMAEGETKELKFKFDVGLLESAFTTENCKAWAIAD